MWNSISTENQFCATRPRKYNDPPECCSFQAKPAVSSEKSPWCCHVKLSHSHTSSHTWSQRAQLFPLATTPNQTQLHQVPCDYAVTKLKQLEEFSPKGLSSPAAAHNGRCNTPWWRVFPSDWRLIHPLSWITEDESSVKQRERPTGLKPASSPQRQPLSWRGGIVAQTIISCTCIWHRSVLGIFYLEDHHCPLLSSFNNSTPFLLHEWQLGVKVKSEEKQ